MSRGAGPGVREQDVHPRRSRWKLGFRDHFSEHAPDYSRYRPLYPETLFDELSDLTPTRNLAWDCGTGNGQAAVTLARSFRNVVGTDASREQVQNASPHPRVDYRVEPAEESSLPNASVDLITVGTAVHWFDFDRFYAEVRRVGRPGGVLAVWTYHLPVIRPEVDEQIRRIYWELLAGYWPERIRYLEEHYTTLPFPFKEIPLRSFQMRASWTLDEMLGFLSSWSAIRRYVDDHGPKSSSRLAEGLADSWGDPDRRLEITWPLYTRVGRLEG